MAHGGDGHDSLSVGWLLLTSNRSLFRAGTPQLLVQPNDFLCQLSHYSLPKPLVISQSLVRAKFTKKCSYD